LRGAVPPSPQDKPVFPSLHDRDSTNLSDRFTLIIEAAGIENPVLRAAKGKGRTTFAFGFHSLRHSFNSELANGGVSSELRQELIGHSSAEINEVYTHRELDRLRAAIAVIPSLTTVASPSTAKKGKPGASPGAKRGRGRAEKQRGGT
jgi:integrase